MKSELIKRKTAREQILKTFVYSNIATLPSTKVFQSIKNLQKEHYCNFCFYVSKQIC